MAIIRLDRINRQQDVKDGKLVYRDTYCCMDIDGRIYHKDFFAPREVKNVDNSRRII